MSGIMHQQDFTFNKAEAKGNFFFFRGRNRNKHLTVLNGKQIQFLGKSTSCVNVLCPATLGQTNQCEQNIIF